MSPIVDAHTHVFAPNSPAYPWDAASPIQPDYAAPVESLLDVMANAGVDHAVVIQHSCYGWDNRYLLDSVKRYPGKFCAMVKVDPLSPNAPGELRRMVEEDGAQGLRLQPSRDPASTWLNVPETFPLWEMAQRLNVIVGILLEPRQLVLAEDVISRCPGVRVIIDHLGRVNLDEPPEGANFQQLLGLSRFPNVCVKVSAFYAFSRQPFPYSDLTPYVRALWQSYGRERLMWATDFPISVRSGEPYAQALTLLRHHLPDLSAEDEAWLMGKTALRLFRF